MAKKLYRVHFMGYYGYDVDVLAEDEDEAKEIAEPISWDAKLEDYYYESNGSDVWEDKKPNEGQIVYEYSEEEDDVVERTYINGEWK